MKPSNNIIKENNEVKASRDYWKALALACYQL